MKYNISIEQSLLSTIFFNQNIDELIDILEPIDFYLPVHQKVYETMLMLHKEDLPIDEEFVRSRGKIEEGALIEILSANAISNARAYAKELKESAKKRELDTLINGLRAKASNEEISSDELLNSVKLSIEQFENHQKADEILHIASFDSIEEHDPKFFLESIAPIQENEINIISAKGGSGKSYATAYLMLELVNRHNLKCFGWFSEDNAGTTKKRIKLLSKLHNLPIKDIAISGKENRAMQFVNTDNRRLQINNLFYKLKKQLKNFDVIVLDPLIAFFGGDENSNADARYFMNLLNEWCEQDNKTIILIHHHSKGEGGTARGAGAFIDACRIHYTLDYKYLDKEKKEIDDRMRILRIEKTNHFSGKKEYELKLFEGKEPNTLSNNFQQSPKKPKPHFQEKHDKFEMPRIFDDEF
jgi:replicative DNA helicase